MQRWYKKVLPNRSEFDAYPVGFELDPGAIQANQRFARQTGPAARIGQ